MKYQKRKDIAEKVALKNHCSKKRSLTQTLPYLQEIFRSKNKVMQENLATYFELDEEEVMWMKR